MNLEEIRAEIVRLQEERRNQKAQILAIRDVVARLVAYEAYRAPDPEGIYQDVSHASDYRIDRLGAGRDLSQDDLKFQEEWRRTVDWIVAAARKMEQGGTDGSSR